MDRTIRARWGLLLAGLFLVSGTAAADELQLDAGTDHVAPQIQHQAPARAVPGRQALTLDAIVTDNVGVDRVTLYYRPVGVTDYRQLAMVPTVGDRFAGVIDARDVVDPGLEYYIEAADGAGNTALRGFSFSPLMVAVGPATPGAPAVAEAAGGAAGAAEPKPWYKKPVVWAIVGGVVVAAAAAGGGGGGGGGGAGASSGTIDISAPTP